MSDSKEEMRAAAVFEAENATGNGELISRALHRREMAQKDEIIKALADALDMLNGRMVTNYESHPGHHEIQNITNAERGMVRSALLRAGRLS